MAYAPPMNKKLLSILLSATLISSSASYLTYAAPKPVTSFDTAIEEETENIIENAPIIDEEINGPKAALSFDTATEQNIAFGTPDLIDTATLSAEALSGAGTEESPYLISNADELMLFCANVNQGVNAGSYYKLTADIDLNGAEWTPIGYLASSNDYSKTFHGVFDGSGYTVSNFKITKADTNYIGFFGYIYEGTVKNFNLDNVTINIVSSLVAQNAYFGTLAGRIVTVNGNSGGKAEISNCNITNSTLDVKTTVGTIYAGGLAGSAISGTFSNVNKSSIIISMCDVDCDMNVRSDSVNRINLAIGGLIGYLGAESGSSMRVLNCNTYGSITSDCTSVQTVTTIAGSVFGLIMTFNGSVLGGEMNISSCHSQGDINAKSQLSVYAGGFAGQISASNLTKIKDCYSSSNINASSSGIYTVLGGFMGMTDYYNFSSENGNNTLHNCYSTGDVIDEIFLANAKGTSYVGAFVGYTPVGIFNNCYKLESQRVVGSDISVDDIKVLNVTQERNKDSYVGFDFDKTWQMDTEADFFYPTLREKIAYVKFINENTIFHYGVFDTDGKTTIPEIVPTKDSTIDLNFKFSHWSLTENGEEFDFDNPVYENTTLYAVFASSLREYKVNFISNGEKYVDEASIAYGEKVIVPGTIPTRDDEGRYYYEFSHWAISEGGIDCNPSEYTVSGDLTFYAVFTEFDRNMWTGNIADSFASGYGTSEMPYMIERAEELAFMQKVINQKHDGYANAYYALADDINLGGKDWMPIGTSAEIPFSGHFDGNGFRISNYKVMNSTYAGFFGYVKNATIKNVHLADFDINFTVNTTESELRVYTGGVAGYVDNVKFNGEISGIRVSGGKFDVDGNAHHIYAGGIIGFGTAHSAGSTTIKNSFVTNPIKVTAQNGYAYAGGIAARLETNTASISKIVNCYNIGDVSANALNSCWSGGLVGYLFSSGSSFITGSTSGENASLSDDDTKDTMIADSFALANVSGVSENYQYVGYIAGDISDYAKTSAVLYTGEKTITGNKVEQAGTKIASKYFLDKDFIFNEMAFDFENTWTYLSSGYEYPILQCMVSDKPGIKIVSTSLKDGTLDINAQTNSQNYTIIIAVYSARNQMLKVERIKADGFMEFDISYDGMDMASYVKLSAISNDSFKPLFEVATHEI